MTRCSICGQQVDINADHIIECATCTMRGVAHVEALEKEVGMDIKDTRYYKMAVKKYIHNERAPRLALRLDNLRKSKGWTSKVLAEIIGVSKQYTCDMLRGRKPLNIKALALIGIKINGKKRTDLLRAYFWRTFGIENKGDNTPKNGIFSKSETNK